MLFSKPTLHKREDGTHYLFDLAEFELQQGKLNSIAEVCNDLAEKLTQYETTKGRAKRPEYLLGALQGKAKFIEDSRADEIYESLKDFPLGETAKASLVAQTLDEFPKEMYRDFERYDSDLQGWTRDLRARLDFAKMFAIEAGADRCTVSVNGKYLETMRKEMEIDIPEITLQDFEIFRQAIRLLWSLYDKGWHLHDKCDMASGMILPSTIDYLMRPETASDIKGREQKLEDANLINSLKRR